MKNDKFHETLLEMVKTKKPSDVGAVVTELVADNLVDLMRPVHPVGGSGDKEPFLGVWIDSLSGSNLYWRQSDIDTLGKCFESPDGQWLGTECPYRQSHSYHKAGKTTIFQRWLNAVTLDRATFVPPDEAMFSAVPKAVLDSSYSPPQRGALMHDILHGNQSKNLLLSRILKSDKANPARDVDDEHTCLGIIKCLANKGFTLTGDVNGSALAYYFSHPDHWDMFLDQGGDPNRLVEQRSVDDDGTLVPLWRGLWEAKKNSRVGERIKEWAQGEPSVAANMKAALDATYWRNIASAYGKGDRLKAIKSRKNWHEITDVDGRTVPMAIFSNEVSDVTSAEVSVIKDLFGIKKSKPMRSAKDNLGRNLWPYFIYGTREVTKIPDWFAKHVPKEPDNEGRGWFQQLQSKERWLAGASPFDIDNECGLIRKKRNGYLSLRVAWTSPTLGDALDDPNMWLSGDENEQDAVVDFLAKYSGPDYRDAGATSIRDMGRRWINKPEVRAQMNERWASLFLSMEIKVALSSKKNKGPDWDAVFKYQDEGAVCIGSDTVSQNTLTCTTGENDGDIKRFLKRNAENESRRKAVKARTEAARTQPRRSRTSKRKL